MSVHEQIVTAARQLAAEKPLDDLSLADVARAAGVSWPTARRHIGSKARLKELLETERAETTPPDLNTRGKILAAAARVFARQGYNGASLDDVAAVAGLTKGAVYWHFAGKSDLFLALLEEQNRRQAADLPAQAGNLRGVEGLTAVLGDAFEACREQQDWPSLLLEFSASARNPQVRERLRELYRIMEEAGREVVLTAQNEGRLAPDLDPRAVSVLFGAVLRGLLLTWLVDPDQVDAADLIPQLAQALWQGIGPQ